MPDIKTLSLKGRLVGSGQPVFIIGEIGSNHNRDKSVVKRLIDACCEAGFDAVKFQTYDPTEIFSAKISTKEFNYEGLYGDRPWWEVARDRILMPRDWFKEMFDYAKSKGLLVFSTIHSVEDAEFIMQFDPPLFKVASIDLAHLTFLSALARFRKPIILSTGMSYMEEIAEAVGVIRDNGNNDIAVLHCVSCYPPEPEWVNLRNIVTLQQKFHLPVGFSDHSPNNYLAFASVALGSCIIEKHVTLDRNMKGPDHPFALTPELMKELVSGVREIENGLGSLERNLSEEELDMRRQVRRSIIARRHIKKGEIINREMVKLARPGTGIEAKHIDSVVGKRVRVDIDTEDVITWEMVE